MLPNNFLSTFSAGDNDGGLDALVRSMEFTCVSVIASRLI